MKLLNLCCGAVRPQGEEWINVDNLHASLPLLTPERINLDCEPRYVNRDIVDELLPNEWDEMFDGILASHCVEHWNCQDAVRIMGCCRECLKPGGVLLVSVPDASYFRQVHDEDTVENAQRLFGEPIHLPDGETTFLGYGLFNRYHKAILTEDALWCYFKRAGFGKIHRILVNDAGEERAMGGKIGLLPRLTNDASDAMFEMVEKLNRIPFSLVMAGVKE